jgi:hypothetical protein
MRTIDLTVVTDVTCSASRAYLAYLRAAGLRPQKALLVEFGPPPQPTGRLQRLLGARAGAVLQRAIGRGKPKAAAPARDALFEDCCEQMQAGQPLRVDYFGEFDYAAHAQTTERCRATGYSDPLFQERLRRETGALLYTCGDRVPRSLTEDPRVRIVHIHPGVVPPIRGSDGLLWSIAVRGRPGASCFYMDEGLDTGAVIATREFEPPRFPRLARHLDAHEPTLYRALLHSYDPHLRGRLLVEVVRANEGRSLRELPSKAQRRDEGRSWFAMHPRLRRKVLAERVLC